MQTVHINLHLKYLNPKPPTAISQAPCSMEQKILQPSWSMQQGPPARTMVLLFSAEDNKMRF